MMTVLVQVSVKPECVEAFKAATAKNAAASRLEPGVTRFDALQALDDPSQFVLEEAYRDETAARAHKDTPHYKAWRDAVEPMMAAPRSSRRFRDPWN
jgi:quinol monooxygenase YgiN